MIRQRRSLAALTVLVLLLTFGAVSQAWAANALISYWAPLGAGEGTWAGPGSIPNPDGEPTPVSARGNSIAFADATHGWTVGYRLPVSALGLPSAPWVASTSDGGSSWSTTGTVLTDFAGYELHGVAAPDMGSVWAVGDGGLIIKRGLTDASWTQQASGTTQQLNAVAFADTTHGWAVGDGGVILATTNGSTWAAVTGVPAVAYQGIAVVDSTHVRVVGASGTVAYWNGSGGWSSTTVSGSPVLRSVSFADANHGWVAGDGLTMRYTSNGCATWSTQTLPTPGDVTASPKSVAFSDSLRGIAVGGHETVWRTANGGAKWETEQFPSENGWSGDILLTSVAYVPGSTGSPSTLWTSGHEDILLDPSAFAIKGTLYFAYTLTYGAGAGGTITGTSPQTVNSGGSGSQVTATPNTGYHFVSWSDGYPTAARTDTNVTADKSVTASFAINTYTLTYGAGTGGTIVGTSPQTVNYNTSGTQVTATPNTGYHFVSWSDGYPTAARTDTNVTADKSVTASFAINTYTLTYGAGAGGTITGTSPQTVNSGGSGSQVTATPNTGYHFVSWSDAYPTAARTDTNVTASKSVTASFEADAAVTYTLTYGAGTGGTIVGTSPQTVNSGGSGSQVTATPNTGYHFVSWSDGYPTAVRTDTNVTADKSVTASFAINTYTLTYSAGAGGTITGTSPQTVNSGGSGSQVTATPNTGYHFVSWSDGYPTAARTDTNVTADKSVTASFAINTYTLTYGAGTGGTIVGTSPQTVNYNTSGTQVTATPNTGYHFVSWSDGYPTAARTDTNVTADKSVTASFAINTYTLTYGAGAGGTITGTSPQTVNSGGSGSQVTATPNTGYHFVSWSDAYPTAARTDSNVTASKSVTASFAADAPTPLYLPVWRFYNFKKNTHFYTANPGEKQNVIDHLSNTYRFEDVAYEVNTLSADNVTPLYRFYNFKKNTHFYTANPDEKQNVIDHLSNTYRFEGPAYNVCATNVPGSKPVWRFYNFKQNTHFYTANPDEKQNVMDHLSNTYRFEGPAFYIAP